MPRLRDLSLKRWHGWNVRRRPGEKRKRLNGGEKRKRSWLKIGEGVRAVRRPGVRPPRKQKSVPPVLRRDPELRPAGVQHRPRPLISRKILLPTGVNCLCRLPVQQPLWVISVPKNIMNGMLLPIVMGLIFRLKE